MGQPEDIVQRIAQAKGVDAPTIQKSLLEALASNHLFRGLVDGERPTALDRLIDILREDHNRVVAEQGKDRFDVDRLKQMVRENEAVFLVLQEIRNVTEHKANEWIVKVDEDERRREGR